jgi:hypothetical protein
MSSSVGFLFYISAATEPIKRICISHYLVQISSISHHTKLYNRYHSLLLSEPHQHLPSLLGTAAQAAYNINTNQTFAINGLQWKISVATRHNDPPTPLQLAHLLNSFMWPPWFPKGHIHKGSTSYTQATRRAADSRRLPGLWAAGSGRVLVAYWGQQRRRACNTVSSTQGAMRWSEFNSSACITPVSSISFYHVGDFFACLCQWHLPLSYSILAHMQLAPSDQVAVKSGFRRADQVELRSITLDCASSTDVALTVVRTLNLCNNFFNRQES